MTATTKKFSSGWIAKASRLNHLIRVQRVMSIKVLSKKSGISRVSLGRYMSLETEPKDSVVDQICVGLGEYAAQFIGEEKPAPSLPVEFIDANHNGRIDPQDAKLHKADALAHEVAWTKQFELAVADGHLSAEDKASLAFIEALSERHGAAASAVLQHC